MSKVKPEITNLNTPIRIDLGKRVEDIHNNILVKCPNCGDIDYRLEDPADIEYGSFFLPDECLNCGQEYVETNYKLKAYIVIEEE